MPDHTVHCYFDRFFFGKSYWRIHKKMDAPAKAFGKAHRLFYHDLLTAREIALSLYPGDPNAVKAAYWHILIDYLCSRNPNLKRNLKRLVQLHSRRKRRSRKAHARRRVSPKERLQSKYINLIVKKVLTG